jgi:hypothetical protein
MIRMLPSAFGMPFAPHFPIEDVHETNPTMASEDFGSFGAEWHVPSVFWFVGGVDRDLYAKAKKDGTIGALPTNNHSPSFAPVIHPTVETGVEALVVSAQAWGPEVRPRDRVMEPFRLAMRMDTFQVILDLGVRVRTAAGLRQESSTGSISSVFLFCRLRPPTPEGSHAMS